MTISLEHKQNHKHKHALIRQAPTPLTSQALEDLFLEDEEEEASSWAMAGMDTDTDTGLGTSQCGATGRRDRKNRLGGDVD
jgi:hypothetical protein